MPESSSSTDRLFVVARLGRPHGLDGYMGLYVDESDLSYFEPEKTVIIEGRPHVVRAVRRADKGHQVLFDGIAGREAADEIRGKDIHVAERRDLEPGEYWPEDLVGLEARDETGTRLGEVVDVVTGGPQDRLVISGGEARFEVPFVAELVPVVEVTGGYVEVSVLPGLIES